MAGPIGTHAPRFLLLRGGAIGDFIVTLPVLQALRAQWPLARIDIWGYPHIAELAVAGGLAEKVQSLDRADMARFFTPRAEFTEEQVAAIRSYDLIFHYLHDPAGHVHDNLLQAGARQVIQGPPMISRGHAVPFLLEPLQALAIYEAELVPELVLSGEARADARRRLQELGVVSRPIVVHPGSGSPAKTWPLPGFMEIIQRLCACGHDVVAVLGEADQQARGELAGKLPDLPCLEGLSLIELAAVLTESSRFLGNDSGITHLAAAVGLPVVALFGPSKAETWAPRGRGEISVLTAPEGELERLEIETVWQELGNRGWRL